MSAGTLLGILMLAIGNPSTSSDIAERERAATDPHVPAPYEDPLLGFTALVPGPGWRLESGHPLKSAGYEDFRIQGTGFASWRYDEDQTEIAVASMILSHELSAHLLPRLAELFEQTRFPPGRRVAGEVTQLNGYPSYLAGYEADGTRATYVYLLAGRRFFILGLEGASPILSRHVPLFRRLLETFKALPLPVGGKGGNRAPDLPHRVAGEGLGFTLNCPEGWETERVGETMVVVSGPGDSDLPRVHLSFQFSEVAGDASRLHTLIRGFRDQLLEEYPRATLSPSRGVRTAQGLLKGLQFHADFSQGRLPMRQWISVVQDEHGYLFFIFVRGPRSVIEKHGPVINGIVDTLTPAH